MSDHTEIVVPDHYKATEGGDTIDFCLRNNLDFSQGNVVKYVVRFRKKGGLIDLLKAQEYLTRLINFVKEYGLHIKPAADIFPEIFEINGMVLATFTANIPYERKQEICFGEGGLQERFNKMELGKPLEYTSVDDFARFMEERTRKLVEQFYGNYVGDPHGEY